MKKKPPGPAAGLKGRAYILLSKYGITETQHDEILARQGGVCAICATDPVKLRRRLCVDHCHETGKVRGLICDTCNGGLARFRDDPRLLLAAAEYLQSTFSLP